MMSFMIVTACVSPKTMPLTHTPINPIPSILVSPTPISPIQMTLEIQLLECPRALTLGRTESYIIAFQVLENGQPAQAGIEVNFLVDDTIQKVIPKEAMTDEHGQVETKVSPKWQGHQQLTVVVGAMILPQRIGASCITEVKLNS